MGKKKELIKQRVHEIEIDNLEADDILYHNKNFLVKRNSDNYQKGDVLVFKVTKCSAWSIYSSYHDNEHSLYNREYKVKYVQVGSGLEEGYAALGIEPVK